LGPISGYDSKLADVRQRHLIAALCYGCQIGPSQLARAISELKGRQIAWIDLRHITEEALDEAIRIVVNGYNRFVLPTHWGNGRSVSADGTKWDLYEQNLLAEYHIRYGGYGGIGYYHVSDTYIALFSHFIPCGVWEAVYILDGPL
jgi:TnpA family transposase